MTQSALDAALKTRFGDADPVPEALTEVPALAALAARGSCRRFTDQPVENETLRTLAAVALAAPSKSDLQQRDILIIQDADVLNQLKALLVGQDWIAGARHLVVFCASHNRQQLSHQMWQRPFANHHLDAFFNASVDAGIALATFMVAAEAAGLGCCPISTIRNRIAEVSEVLGLPDHVFPVAGMAVGHPAPGATHISPRLPLAATVHTDRYDSATQEASICAYDERRKAYEAAYRAKAGVAPDAPHPTWSDAKTQMYARVQRDDFGAFVRKIGFSLD